MNGHRRFAPFVTNRRRGQGQKSGVGGNPAYPRLRPSPHPIALYEALYRRWGPQGWWPAKTPFETVVGAILTQNTAWTNVERAIANLRSADALSPDALRALPPERLAELIRPAGYFNVKARRLRAFLDRLFAEFGGSLDRLFKVPTDSLRRLLLSIHGIGPETADSILLYAAERPVFVADAYTRRALVRHGWAAPDASYDALTQFFSRRLPRDTALFNEYHALIVQLGKEQCRSQPLCDTCPWQRWLPRGGPRVISRAFSARSR